VNAALVPLPPPLPDFRSVFETYAPFVWRVLKRLGVREAEVADVSQETFLVLHKRLATFEGRSSLKTFVYGVAVRVAADHRKRAWVRKEQATDEIPEQGGTAPTAERALQAKESLQALDRALAELDEDKRTVFVLYELEELSLAEIAEVTELAISTLHSRLALAREHVRRRLTPRSSSPTPPRVAPAVPPTRRLA
jgi:RNA polymerase sigma-70 factor, ECF subfamily